MISKQMLEKKQTVNSEKISGNCKSNTQTIRERISVDENISSIILQKGEYFNNQLCLFQQLFLKDSTPDTST